MCRVPRPGLCAAFSSDLIIPRANFDKDHGAAKVLPGDANPVEHRGGAPTRTGKCRTRRLHSGDLRNTWRLGKDEMSC